MSFGSKKVEMRDGNYVYEIEATKDKIDISVDKKEKDAKTGFERSEFCRRASIKNPELSLLLALEKAAETPEYVKNLSEQVFSEIAEGKRDCSWFGIFDGKEGNNIFKCDWKDEVRISYSKDIMKTKTKDGYRLNEKSYILDVPTAELQKKLFGSEAEAKKTFADIKGKYKGIVEWESEARRDERGYFSIKRISPEKTTLYNNPGLADFRNSVLRNVKADFFSPEISNAKEK